jgi:hypothetical protein
MSSPPKGFVDGLETNCPGRIARFTPYVNFPPNL